MRDPDRIPRILDKIKQAWETYPDMRLGQLFMNVLPHGYNPFYYEDDHFEIRLDEWLDYIERARASAVTEK